MGQLGKLTFLNKWDDHPLFRLCSFTRRPAPRMAEDWNFELIVFHVKDVDQTNVLTNDLPKLDTRKIWVVIFLVPNPLVAAVGQWLASSKADEKARLTAFSLPGLNNYPKSQTSVLLDWPNMEAAISRECHL